MTLGLDGYFDESERNQQGSEPISVAGYIFKPTAYRSFCRAWKRMLVAGPKPTTHFHMTNLYARDHEYKGWTVEERANVLRLAVEAVRTHMHCGISVLFSQSEFERLAPPLWKFEYGSIYAASCQLVLDTTYTWMTAHKSFLPIAYAFESGHRFWDEADDLLKGISKHPDLKRKYRYRTHFALDKTESYGLQAADMWAWIMTRVTVGVPPNHTMRAFGPIIMSLVENDSDRYQLFHPKGAVLKQFFDEQVNNKNHLVIDFDRAKKMRLR